MCVYSMIFFDLYHFCRKALATKIRLRKKFTSKIFKLLMKISRSMVCHCMRKDLDFIRHALKHKQWIVAQLEMG